MNKKLKYRLFFIIIAIIVAITAIIIRTCQPPIVQVKRDIDTPVCVFYKWYYDGSQDKYLPWIDAHPENPCAIVGIYWEEFSDNDIAGIQSIYDLLLMDGQVEELHLFFRHDGGFGRDPGGYDEALPSKFHNASDTVCWADDNSESGTRSQFRLEENCLSVNELQIKRRATTPMQRLVIGMTTYIGKCG